MHTRQTAIAAATVLTSLLILGACDKAPKASATLYDSVDNVSELILANTSDYAHIVDIDHSRLAAEEGVTMPPSRVSIYANPELNAQILQQAPLAGIDLPYKVLAFADAEQPAFIYTGADFIVRRHGLAESAAIAQYRSELHKVTEALPSDQQRALDTSAVSKHFGLEILPSEYAFAETIERVKKAVLAQDDTIWFADIDYHATAKNYGIELPNITLLLFGAPAPGGKAMAKFPSLGLDAFCQKVLVYQAPDGQVNIYFNNIVDFARLHYGKTALPHRVINFRLNRTLGRAIK